MPYRLAIPSYINHFSRLSHPLSCLSHDLSLGASSATSPPLSCTAIRNAGVVMMIGLEPTRTKATVFEAAVSAYFTTSSYICRVLSAALQSVYYAWNLSNQVDIYLLHSLLSRPSCTTCKRSCASASVQSI